MFIRRFVLPIVVLATCLLAQTGHADDALTHYYERLQEISRIYRQQLSEVRKVQRRMGSDIAHLRAAEKQIKQLAIMRNRAIAEAILAFRNEQKDSGPSSLAGLSRAQRESDLWAAQQQSSEDEQKEFWAKAAREDSEYTKAWAEHLQAVQTEEAAFWSTVLAREPQEMKVWADRVLAVQEEQSRFWDELFQPPQAVPRLTAPSGPVTETPVVAKRDKPAR